MEENNDESNIELPAENLPENQINVSEIKDDLSEEDITELQVNEEETREPVVEELCVKKFAYQTTDDDEKIESLMVIDEITSQIVEGKKKYFACLSKF